MSRSQSHQAKVDRECAQRWLSGPMPADATVERHERMGADGQIVSYYGAIQWTDGYGRFLVASERTFEKLRRHPELQLR